MVESEIKKPGEDNKTNGGETSSGCGSYKQRFLFALFPCGLLCFIYLFFGSLSLIYANTAAFHITLSQATPWYLAAFVVATAALAAALALLRGRVFDGAVNFTLWAGIASYIQRNMLNIDLGLLDGKTIPWHEYTSQALINLGVWLALLLAVSIAAALLGKRWKKVVCFASAILILMQTTALVTFYIDAAAQDKAGERYYLSTDSLRDISARENVFVFIIDACSNTAVERTLSEYPDALDGLDDFTYYRNCGPTYYGTYPELIATFTGNAHYDTDRSYKDYNRESWTSDKANAFYGLLHDAGYTVNFYTKGSVITHNYENVRDKLDNAVWLDTSWIIHPREMYTKVGILTLWEYLPTAAKACFFTTPLDFNDMAALPSKDASLSWAWDGSQLSDALRNGDLKEVEDNVFAMYHMPGAHPPYVVDENGFSGGGGTSLESQVKGNLLTIDSFLNELKELGVYDSSTIIIMGDHGDGYGTRKTLDGSAALFVKRRNERRETMAVSDAPVTHSELIPTIVKDVDPDGEYDFGKTLAEIEEDKARERRLYVFKSEGYHTDWTYDCLYVYDYNYNVNDLDVDGEPNEILPLYDNFY